MLPSRIERLRNESLSTETVISHERAVLLTRFYREHEADAQPVALMRARALAFILSEKAIWIGPDELIVGERGPSPKAVPTYPEICIHSIEDLRMLNDREKVAYKVDAATYSVYSEEIIPFWKGRSIREKIFEAVPERWKTAYDEGYFTEFLEQRAPGHTVLGAEIYREGIGGIRARISERKKGLDDSGPEAVALQSMEIALDALSAYAIRHSEQLGAMAVVAPDEERRSELLEMARCCRKISVSAPDTFHEALQLYWFIHVGIITELNPWDSFNPGRLDQHLLPFYERGLNDGSLTKERARELLMAFWVKFNNHPAPPKTGVTAKESNTYTDFALINLGGMTRDGDNAVNELSYLILDVISEMRLLQPSSMIQVCKATPDDFILRALEIIRTGFGQPSVFNSDAIVKELVRQGKTPEDAREGGASGCVESGAFGRESYILTGYFNLPKILERTLSEIEEEFPGKAADSLSFDDLKASFVKVLRRYIDIKIEGNEIIEGIYAREMPAPLLSAFIDGCISNGKDYNAGGATYHSRYIQGVGLGTITDSLTALKHHVFDRGTISLSGFIEALRNDFRDFEELRRDLIWDTPKYGNDDPYADEEAAWAFTRFFECVDGRASLTGGIYRVNMLPTTSHVYFGSKTGATPDGRKAGTPFSEGISPVQGADRKGPSAVIRSASVFDHTLTGGTLLNQKFTPGFFSTEKAMKSLIHLVRAYFAMDGHHVQFNVVDAETLRDAQKYPERYRDLIVRVAGYSDYFNDLGRDLQDEIIRRTEQA